MLTMRSVATLLGSLAIVALPSAGRAETVRFAARLASDVAPPSLASVGGHAMLELDTATRIVTWRIEYSGMAQPPLSIGCGARDQPELPSIHLTAGLTSPVTGSKVLTDAEATALTAGGWACVISTDSAGVDIGGFLQPER